MKITKPSELREGMRIKFKCDGVDYWTWAHKGKPIWRAVGGTGTGLTLTTSDWELRRDITDLESIEGIRAAKEGDVLEDSDGNEFTVVFCNEFCFTMVGYDTTLSEHSITRTYAHAEAKGYKLKDQEQPTLEPVIDLRNGHHGSDVCDCINAERLKADTINLPDEIRINGRAYRVWDSSSTDTD